MESKVNEFVSRHGRKNTAIYTGNIIVTKKKQKVLLKMFLSVLLIAIFVKK